MLSAGVRLREAGHERPELTDSGRTWWHDGAIAVGVSVVALITRLAYAARWPTEWDSAQLALGLDRFDVTEHSPHPPGYWLYVASGRLVRALTPLDAHGALVVVAAFASAAAVGVAYLAGRRAAGRWLGLAAAAVLLASPYLWFYGASANTYAFDALGVSLLVLLALRARPGSLDGVAAAVVLGFIAGFRTSALLLLGPVAAVAVWRSSRSWSQALAAIGGGAGAVLVWLVPMLLEQPGGLSAWRASLDELWRQAYDRTSVLIGGPAAGINMRRGVGETLAAAGLLLPITVAAVVVLVLVRRRRGRAGWSGWSGWSGWTAVTPARVLALAALPGLAFVILVHFGKSGYVLTYLAPLVLLLLLPAARTEGRTRWVLSVAVGLVCVVSAQRFVSARGILPDRLADEVGFVGDQINGAPYQLTATEIRKFDDRTRAFLGLRDAFDPDRDVLVFAAGNGGELFRNATFALPEFTVDLIRGQVVEMRGRRGRWAGPGLRRIEVPHDGRAVFLPVNPPVGGELVPVRVGDDLEAWYGVPGTTVAGLPVVERSHPYDPAEHPDTWPPP